MTGNPGGVESVVVGFVRSLHAEVRFDFWTNGGQMAFEEELIALGCGVFHGRRYSRHPLGAHRDLVNFLGERPGFYDVLWSNKSMCANVDDLASALQAGVPKRIIHAHNSRDMFTGPIGRLKSWQHRRNTARLASLATDFWACSLGAATYFSSGHREGWGRFELIRNAINPSAFEFDSQARDRLRAELGVGGSVPVVGFVGRLQFQKHPELAIGAFREFRRSHPAAVLVMIGDGDLRARCEAAAVEAGIGEAVRFLGALGSAALWYSAFDVLLMPSRFEGLPMVAVEAQAAALPVIVSEGVPREVAFTDLVRFLPLGASAASWADELTKALVSAPRRASMAGAVSDGGYDLAREAERVGRLLRGVE